MRLTILLFLFLPVLVAQKKPDIWEEVPDSPNIPRLKGASLTRVQLRAVDKLLSEPRETDMWDCEGSDLEEMIHGLIFEEIPLAQDQNVLLVEAGAGCGRGGQGANGAMWLIRFDGDVPALLASPKGKFGGWLYSIQPSVSHGYHDLVLGWHMSAGEAGLVYFRFDGKSYIAIGAATESDDGIVPTAQ